MQPSNDAEAATALATGGFVVMGRVMAPYGVAGWIKVQPYTEAPDALLAYGSWWLRKADARQWHRRESLDGRRHADVLLARLSGVESREAALALKGCEIAVRRTDLPAAGKNEIYQADLVGLEVVNRAGIGLGRVAGVTEHGAHPLLRVVAEGPLDGERLIPYVPAYVDRVDLAAGTIVVDWGVDF